jgi:hypothetical protein
MATEPRLTIAFPKSETEVRVVFSEAIDPDRAQDPASYSARRGLRVRSAQIDPRDPCRVTLKTDAMNGEAMETEVLSATGVRTRSGRPLANAHSPEFIKGLASIPEIQRPEVEAFPFTSRFNGKVASASCGKDGGVDSNVLIDTFGFAFIHMEAGGPFNSLKISTKQHIPGIADITRGLQQGQTAHVLWAGGEIRTVNGETQLVDTGYIEGSVIPPHPLRSPRPFPIKTADLAVESGRTLRAKSLHGVIVWFEHVTIDKVSQPDKSGLRRFSFQDGGRGRASGVILANVKKQLKEGQKLSGLRGLVHSPKAGECEVIVELDEHLALS